MGLVSPRFLIWRFAMSVFVGIPRRTSRAHTAAPLRHALARAGCGPSAEPSAPAKPRSFLRRTVFSVSNFQFSIFNAFLLSLALSSSPLHAVSPYTPSRPDPVLESWRWTTFPELNGLGLVCMAEDREGRMWFGVDDGVRVYDGVTWKSYTEADGLLGQTFLGFDATVCQ